MSQKRVLTGITTTGIPHLGNYVGAIRPAIAESRASGEESFLFLADYHASSNATIRNKSTARRSPSPPPGSPAALTPKPSPSTASRTSPKCRN